MNVIIIKYSIIASRGKCVRMLMEGCGLKVV